MEEGEECRTRNVASWELLLNLIASEEMGGDRTRGTEPASMAHYLSNPRIKHLLTEWLSNMHYLHARKRDPDNSTTKCDEIALRWRQRGNEVYTKPNGPIKDAYEFYQWSVVFARQDGPMLPLALANRSAALFRLKKYKECLSDIEWALKLGYPSEQHQKLLLRRADCLVELGLKEEAKEAMQQAVLHTTVTLSPTATTDFENIAKQVEQKLHSAQVIDSNSVTLPQPLQGYNDSFVHASKALQLVRNEDVGRYVVTQHKVNRGDVLFSEEPYAHVALPGVGPVCETCCATDINIVPCKVCTRVSYCSLECRDRGEVLFHRWECVGFQSELFHTIGIAHLALRVMLMMTNEGFPTPLKPTETIQQKSAQLAQKKAPREQSRVLRETKDPDQSKGTSEKSTGTIRKNTLNNGVMSSKNMADDKPVIPKVITTTDSSESRPSNDVASNIGNQIPDTNEQYSEKALSAILQRSRGLDENGEKIKPKELKVQAEELFASYQTVDNIEIYKPDFPPFYRMFNLVTNFNNMSNHDYAQYCATAALLTHYLDKYTRFFDFLLHQLPYSLSDSQLRVFTAAVCLRSIGQLICNGHAATTLVTGNRTEHELRRATAIYPSTAMMNHSCDPNIVNNFYKNRLIVRCARELTPGTPVSNCYGPHYARIGFETRQNILRAQYGFNCRCEACSDRERQDFAKTFSAYACLYCKAPLQAAVAQCNHCRKPVLVDTRRDLIERADELSAEAATYEKVSAICEAEQIAMKNRQRAFHRHNTELREHADYLACLYSECGQFGKAIELIKQNTQSAEYQFGSFSSEVANELRKLSDAMFKRIQAAGSATNPNYRDWCLEAHKVVRKAVTLMEQNYGPWEPLVVRLQEQEAQVAEQLAGMRSPEEDHDIVESVHYNMHYNLKI